MPKGVFYEVIVGGTIRTGMTSRTRKAAIANAKRTRTKYPNTRKIEVTKFTPTKSLGKKAFTFKTVWKEK